MTRPLLRFLLLGLILSALPVHAQRIAFVDTKYILDQMPEYAAAQKELDKDSKDWQDEIDQKWAQIKRLRDAFNAEAILLTEEMKKARQDEIDKKEQEARDLQQKRFGVGGDLFKKRQELIQPIQDRIYDAVKEVAGTSYVAIFDIGGVGNNVLYASDKYDKSESVLHKLGIRPSKDKNGGNPGNTRDDDDDDNGGNTTPPKDGSAKPSGSPTTPSRGNTDMKPKQ